MPEIRDVSDVARELQEAIDELLVAKRRQGLSHDEASAFVMDAIRRAKAAIDEARA